MKKFLVGLFAAALFLAAGTKAEAHGYGYGVQAFTRANLVTYNLVQPVQRLTQAVVAPVVTDPCGVAQEVQVPVQYNRLTYAPALTSVGAFVQPVAAVHVQRVVQQQVVQPVVVQKQVIQQRVVQPRVVQKVKIKKVVR